MDMKKKIFLYSLLFLVLIGCDQSVYDGSSPEEIVVVADVYVSSIPEGASIFLDGRITGFITPDTIKSIEVGEHSIVLKRKLYSDTLFTITIENEAPIDLSIDMTNNFRNFGIINCTSEPSGANVFLNDSSTGEVTSVMLNNVPAGIYEVKYELHKHRADSSIVYLNSQSTVTFNGHLTDTTYWVDYNTSTINVSTNDFTDVLFKDNSLWFSTMYHGLVEFNGKDWLPHPINDPLLTNKLIRRIVLDNYNNIWLCIDGYLVRYENGIQEIIFNELLGPEFKELKFDSQNNFICATRKGLIKYDRTEWLNYSDLFQDHDLSFVNDVAIVNDTTFYLGTNSHRLVGYAMSSGGVYKIEGSKLSVFLKSTNIYAYYNVQQLEFDKNSRLWIGVARTRYSSGSVLYYMEDGELIEYQPSNIISREILNTQFNRFYVSDQNTLWMSTEGGLISITDGNVGSAYTYLNTILPRSGVNSVILDKRNNVWVTSPTFGIFKFKGINF